MFATKFYQIQSVAVKRKRWQVFLLRFFPFLSVFLPRIRAYEIIPAVDPVDCHTW